MQENRDTFCRGRWSRGSTVELLVEINGEDTKDWLVGGSGHQGRSDPEEGVEGRRNRTRKLVSGLDTRTLSTGRRGREGQRGDP